MQHRAQPGAAAGARAAATGFTLLELIVVLLILGILAAIAIPTFNTIQENSARGSAQATAEAIGRNANAIAGSTQGAGGVVTQAILQQAASEVLPNVEDYSIATGAVIPKVTSGNVTCRAMVAIVNGRTEVGPATCGDQATAFPDGYNEGGGGGGGGGGAGTITVSYPTTSFDSLVVGATSDPVITGAATTTINVGCWLDPDFYSETQWADYGYTSTDCDDFGGVWVTNYNLIRPDVTVAVTAGTLPPGLLLDPGTGRISVLDWPANPGFPSTVTITVTDSTGSTGSTTLTLTSY